MTATGNSTVTPIKSCAGTTDAAGSGAVRLTNAQNNESGYLFYNSPLPDTAGIDVTFDSYQYSGTGADGIAFFLTDGQHQLVAPGVPGGYLGYAGGNHTGIGVGNGVAHGLFGVGLDAYGNFSNFENSPLHGGGNCPNTYTPARVKDAVVLRGPGNADELNYCYLAGANAPSTLHVDSATDRLDGGLNDVVRHVHIVVDPSSDAAPKVTVSVNGTQVLKVAEPAMTATVKFGWTASTGGSTNIHEIQNVTVTTINPLGPSLSVSNTVSSGGVFASGGSAGDAAYTITNAGGADFETQPFTLTVPVPAGLGFTGRTVSDPNMSCAASTATQLSCTYTPSGYGFAPAQAVTVHLLFSPTTTYSHKDLVLTASVSSPDGGSPTTNQTIQVYPMAVPSPITTTVNVPATVAQGANGTASFTWLVGPGTGNPALVSTATVDAAGNLTMTPVPRASGTTTIPLSVQDASGLTSATVNVPVTVRPTVSAVVGSGTGPAPVIATPGAPTGTGPFTYTLVAGSLPPLAEGTTVEDPSTGQITFTPVSGFSGTVTFQYIVTGSGGLSSAPATVSFTVNKPAGPGVSPASATTPANTAVDITPAAATGRRRSPTRSPPR